MGRPNSNVALTTGSKLGPGSTWRPGNYPCPIGTHFKHFVPEFVKRPGRAHSNQLHLALDVWRLTRRAMGKPKNKSVPVRLQRVLDEAEELFAREGFLHFSTDELARRLRCSKRTIYAVAPGREKFFEAVILHRVTKAEEATI